LPDQAKEFLGALSSFDDFWLEVRTKAIENKKPPSLLCGAVIQKTDDGYTLARLSPEPPTVLDVALSILHNIEILSTG
jgi:hypothetical protein